MHIHTFNHPFFLAPHHATLHILIIIIIMDIIVIIDIIIIINLNYHLIYVFSPVL